MYQLGLPPSRRSPFGRALLVNGRASRHASNSSKPTSPHIGFYRSFGRPIAKVFLGAAVTYQFVYILWTKLEMDEVKRARIAEIEHLEDELRQAQAATTNS